MNALTISLMVISLLLLLVPTGIGMFTNIHISAPVVYGLAAVGIIGLIVSNIFIKEDAECTVCPAGPRGDKGATGARGPQGEKGPTGAQGKQGEKGDTGARGATGAQGKQGEKGGKGDKGNVGPVGATGAIGPRGIQGMTGATGEKGQRGEQGVPGHWGPIGPAGPTGAQGPRGATGDVGPQGKTGGIGPRGATGSPGPQGATGDVGPRGGAGPQGATGDVGPRGAQGKTGDKGDKGAKGDTGSAGPRGATGNPGARGATGDVGPRGAKGATGDVGPQGPIGDCSNCQPIPFFELMQASPSVFVLSYEVGGNTPLFLIRGTDYSSYENSNYYLNLRGLDHVPQGWISAKLRNDGNGKISVIDVEGVWTSFMVFVVGLNKTTCGICSESMLNPKEGGWPSSCLTLNDVHSGYNNNLAMNISLYNYHGYGIGVRACDNWIVMDMSGKLIVADRSATVDQIFSWDIHYES